MLVDCFAPINRRVLIQLIYFQSIKFPSHRIYGRSIYTQMYYYQMMFINMFIVGKFVGASRIIPPLIDRLYRRVSVHERAYQVFGRTD